MAKQSLFEEPVIEREQMPNIQQWCPEFSEKSTAIVTGAASGIGRATALLMAANGAKVAMVDVDNEGLLSIILEGGRLGIDTALLAPYPMNLCDANAREQLIRDIVSDDNSIRWLFNIAGVQRVNSIQDFLMEDWDLMMNLMLTAPMHLTKLVWPHMVAAGGGVIGNMGSVHSTVATLNKPAYNVVKGGLLQLTRSITAEGATCGIRSINLEVGYVATALALNQIQPTAERLGISQADVVEKVFLQHSLKKRMMTPLEVAIMFLMNTSSLMPFVTNTVRGDAGFTDNYVTVPPTAN